MVLSMERWKGKVAVVTGASSGIGAAIVTQLLQDGLTVCGLARRKERVEELTKNLKNNSGKLYAIKADITREEDIIEAFQWVKTNVGPVHILVNSAGVCRSATLIDGDTQKWKDILDTNVLGLCIATREAIKDMRSNNVDGHIVHINSVLGHVLPNLPQLNIYPASKFSVTALTETLRQELNSIKSKIKITSVSPGVVKSEFVEAGGYEQTPEMVAYLATIPWLEASDISDAVVYVLSTPPHVQVHELMIRPTGQDV